MKVGPLIGKLVLLAAMLVILNVFGIVELPGWLLSPIILAGVLYGGLCVAIWGGLRAGKGWNH